MKRIVLFFILLATVYSLSAKGKLKVACVGNSVTYGQGLADREKKSYPAQLQTLLGDKYEVGNFGHSGATLLKKGYKPYITRPEYQSALAFKADNVIIHLGLNDTDPRCWPNYRDEFVRDYLDLIASFRQANPKARILICRMTPITHGHRRFESGTRDWYRQIQQKIELIAKIANVQFIDFQEQLYSRPDLLPDALHPDVEGTGILAKQVYSALTGDFGGLQMAEIYSDNMVLQRNKTFEIHGLANANEKVTVEIAGQKVSNITKSDGKWSLVLDPLKVATNLSLKIYTPKKKLHYKNVAVGEVWLSSGQSNMAFKVRESATANTVEANNPNIRLFNMQARWETNAEEWESTVLDSLNKLDYYKPAYWQVADRESILDFSAIAYYFGAELGDSLNIPIGLIDNSVGGSTTESWISRNIIELEIPKILHDWRNNDFIMPWARERASLNVKKSENKNQRHPYEPCYLFEAGIKRLDRYPIQGIIWYQGESNAHNVEVHEKLFSLLIDSWRENWKDETLPFHFVQLSSIDRPSWAHFRDSQRRLAENIPFAYMTVSSDLGDSLDVHPIHKKEIGQRLASSALHHTYAKNHVVPSGPLLKNMQQGEQSLILEFAYAKTLQFAGKKLIGFEIASADQLYKEAEGEIIGNQVRVSEKSILNPTYVRYAYKPFTRGNLQNELGMPASTFDASLGNKEYIKVKTQSLKNYPIKGGVSAPFVGVHNNQLIVAGGCNFVEKDGNQVRTFYNDIYTLELTDTPETSKWVQLKNYPLNIAYGASVNTPEGIVCIGGNTLEGASNQVHLINYNKKKSDIETKILPSLPMSVSNAGATLVGRTIYLAGGAVSGDAKQTVFALNLDALDKGWKQIATPFEPEHQQPVLFTQNNQLFMAGGYNETKAKVFTDVLKFDFEWEQWYPFSQIASDGNDPQTMIGGSAVSYNENEILFVSGVNYERFSSALQRIQKTQQAEKNGEPELWTQLKEKGKEYMSQDPAWYKFRTQLLSFNVGTKEWNSLGNYKELARAGAGIAIHDGKLYIIGGELKPGVRTEESNYIQLK